jgi:hypothetical protein
MCWYKRWAADNEYALRTADPDVGELQNRVADNWRPLFALADLARGELPSQVRAAAAAAIAAHDDQSIRTQLLVDIKAAFDGKDTDRLSSEQLVEHLVSLDDRPWAEWRGRPLTKSKLARLLTPFGILSGTIRLGEGHTAKGYYRHVFDDAFGRYLPSAPPIPPFQNVTTSQAYSHVHCDVSQNVTSNSGVTFSKASQAYSRNDCDVVTFLEPLEAELGRCDEE